jgi:hypothetical protein
MQVPDALRVAELFEADDVISVPAMACRVLARYVKELEVRLSEQPEQGVVRNEHVDTPLQE